MGGLAAQRAQRKGPMWDMWRLRATSGTFGCRSTSSAHPASPPAQTTAMAEPYTLPPCFGTTGKEEQLLDGSLWDNRFAGLDQAGKIAAE